MIKIYSFTFVFIGSLVLMPLVTHAAYNAFDVLGQTNVSGTPIYTQGDSNNASSSVNAAGFNFPDYIALDSVNHRLFVTDENYRVLIFNLDQNNNLIDHTADYVLGEPDFTTSNTSGTTVNTMQLPYGIAYDSSSSRLFVADRLNSRVLVWDLSGTISNDMPASFELGQPDGVSAFTSETATTTQTGLYQPYGLAYSSNSKQLFVSDYSSNRILVYDLSGGITNGMAATYELGQPDGASAFSTSTATTTQTGLHNPEAMAYSEDLNQLFVSDRGNNRIMIFDLSGGITNGMAASYELGQAAGVSAFTSSSFSTTQANKFQSFGLAYSDDLKQLFVSDPGGERILIFDLSGGITNGMNATSVLGQDDLTSSNSATTQSGLSGPIDSVYDVSSQKLFVTDTNNNRILIFNFVKLPSTITSTVIVGAEYSGSVAATQSQGTLSYATTSGSLPVGLSLNTSTGAITGTSSVAGTATFTIKVTDTVIPGIQVFTNTQNYTLTSYDLALPGSITSTGTVGTAYSGSAAVSQTGNSLSYAVTSGSLPGGLSLDAGSGAITGTPTTAGTYSFNIEVTATLSPSILADQSYTITIASAPVIYYGGGGGGGGGGSVYTAPPIVPVISTSTPAICPNGKTLSSNCTTAPVIPVVSAQTICPNGKTLVSNCTIPPVAGSSFSILNKTLAVCPNLTIGSNAKCVLTLQQYLNTNNFNVALAGIGSKGHESTHFGLLTKNALIRFQKFNHIVPASGFFGPISRKYISTH